MGVSWGSKQKVKRKGYLKTVVSAKFFYKLKTVAKIKAINFKVYFEESELGMNFLRR